MRSSVEGSLPPPAVSTPPAHPVLLLFKATWPDGAAFSIVYPRPPEFTQLTLATKLLKTKREASAETDK